MLKLSLLGLWLLAGSAIAQPEPVCRPYSIPTPGSTIACPVGFVGLQGTITTKTCPNGVITVSPMITTGCVAKEKKDGGDAPDSPVSSKPAEPVANNKQIALSSQPVAAPIAECPPGQHFSGSDDDNGAHCVPNVVKLPNCNVGVADGRSLTCAAAGMAGYTGTAYRNIYRNASGGGNCAPVETGTYNTNGCVAPIPNCNTGMENARSLTCTEAGLASYTGTAYTVIFGSHNAGGRCNRVPAPGFNTEGCVPPVVKCTPASVNNAAVACSTVLGVGYTGSAHTTSATTCPNGIYEAPKVTISPFVTTECIAPPTTCSFSMNYWSATETPHHQTKKVTLKIGESTPLACDGISQNQGQQFTCQPNGTATPSRGILTGCGIKP